MALNDNKITEDFFRRFPMISEEKKKRIRKKINEVLSYQPKIGIFGKTGVGKSSLCNALFGQDIAPVSDIKACTRKRQEIDLDLGSNKMKLIDVPGVGENKDRDEEYAKLYADLLPELDVVLWLLKADDRAFTSDEEFYKHIVKPHLDEGKPFFIVLNQVDKIEPFREWNLDEGKPGPRQLDNIEKKKNVVSRFFDQPKSKVIPVSAAEEYNLIGLVDEITHALPKDKKYTFLKNVEENYISEKSKTVAKRGFVETIVETVEEVVENARDLVEDIWHAATSWLPF